MSQSGLKKQMDAIMEDTDEKKSYELEDEVPAAKKKKRVRVSESDDEEGHAHRASLHLDDDEVGFANNKHMRKVNGFPSARRSPKKKKTVSDSDDDDGAHTIKLKGRDKLIVGLMVEGMAEVRKRLTAAGKKWNSWITETGSTDQLRKGLFKLVRKKLPDVTLEEIISLLVSNEEDVFRVKGSRKESGKDINASDADDEPEIDEDVTEEDLAFVADDNSDIEVDDEDESMHERPAKPKRAPSTHAEVIANAKRKKAAVVEEDDEDEDEDDDDDDGVDEDEAIDALSYAQGGMKTANFDESGPSAFKTKAGHPAAKKKPVRVVSDDDDEDARRKPPPVELATDDESGSDSDGEAKQKKTKRKFTNEKAKKEFCAMSFATRSLFISGGHEYEVRFRGEDAPVSTASASMLQQMSAAKKRLLSENQTWINHESDKIQYKHLSTCFDIPEGGVPSDKDAADRCLVHFLLSKKHPPIKVSAPTGKTLILKRANAPEQKEIMLRAASNKNVVHRDDKQDQLIVPWKLYDDKIAKTKAKPAAKKKAPSLLFETEKVDKMVDFMFDYQFPEDANDDDTMIRVKVMKERLYLFTEATKDGITQEAVTRVLESTKDEHPMRFFFDMIYMMTPSYAERIRKKHEAALKSTLAAMM